MTEQRANSILVIGYGNPSRGDDGLGPALAARLAERAIDGVTIELPYQLQVEDAIMLSDHDLVIFVDADATCDDPFTFGPVDPKRHLAFTSHSVVPGALLAIARELFGCTADAYVLGIRGHVFDVFEEQLSAAALANLDAALAFLVPLLQRGLERGTVRPEDLDTGKELTHVR